MGRWEPDAAGRLQLAAMELFGERGFESTSVADIAAHAGLTERTFFRHFADKREVLFAGAAWLQDAIVTRLTECLGSGCSPMRAVGQALTGATTPFDDNRDFARRRHAVISANVDLQERELVKLARMATAIADTLRAAGVDEPAASLTAETGVAVFRVAFDRWVAGADDRSLASFVDESMTQLRSATAD